MLPRTAHPVSDSISVLAGPGTATSFSRTSFGTGAPPAAGPPRVAPQQEGSDPGGARAIAVSSTSPSPVDDLFRHASQLSDVCSCLLAVALLALLVALMR